MNTFRADLAAYSIVNFPIPCNDIIACFVQVKPELTFPCWLQSPQPPSIVTPRSSQASTQTLMLIVRYHRFFNFTKKILIGYGKINLTFYLKIVLHYKVLDSHQIISIKNFNIQSRIFS